MIPTALFLAGAIVGSFVNVVVYRFPRGMGFVRGRSHCPHCKNPLTAADLIPIVSFLLLQGKCRYCSQPISARYPLVEALSGLFFVIAYLALAQYGVVTVAYSIIIVELFTIIALIDLDHFIIPDPLLIILLVIGALYTFIWQIAQAYSVADHFIITKNNFMPLIVATSFFFLVWLLTRGKMMGFGDVKYVAVLSFLFGTIGSFWIIYGALAAGAVLGIILIVARMAKGTTKMPLGTFLSSTAILYVFLSPWLIENSVLCIYLKMFCRF